MKLGRLLFTTRMQKKVTQSALAQAAGVSTSYISDIEAGHREPSEDEMLERLATAYGLPDEALYYCVGKLLPNCRNLTDDWDTIMAAYEVFRLTIRQVTG